MALWDKKTERMPDFGSRGEAFAYMLRYQMEEKGVDPMEAAEKAGEFADIFSKNMGLPEKVEPAAQGVDKWLKDAEKVGKFCESHPKAVDMLTGVVTFLAGAITGKAAAGEMAVMPVERVEKEDIDFDKLT